MSGYNQLLSTMMEAILSGDTAPADSLLREKKDFPAAAQLAVYTQGYRLRLREALQSTYPALVFYLGLKNFTALADGFIAAQPSRYFNLDSYTIGFGVYVTSHSDDPFACELATLEAAIHDVYQREETPPLDARWVEQKTSETLAQTPLLLRGAAMLLSFRFPVNDYFEAFRGEEKPARPAEQESWVIVLRHKHQVRRVPLEKAEYTLLVLLAKGALLSDALEDTRMAGYVSEAHFADSLQRWFARWVNEGMIRQPS